MSRSVKRTASFVLVLAAVLASMAGVASAAAPVPAAMSTGQPFNADAVPRPAGLPASAKLVTSTPPPAGKVYIVNQWTGRCLDAFYGDGGGNGNRVGLWDCNGGISEQWYVVGNGRRDSYNRALINARNTNKVLDYPASSHGLPGFQFELWDWIPTTGQDLWFEPDGTGRWWISVALCGGAFVMDAYTSGGGGNGNPVGQWYFTGHKAQLWYLYYLST